MRASNLLGYSFKALLRLGDNVAAWCTNKHRISTNRLSWASEYGVSDSAERLLPMARVGLTFDVTPTCAAIIADSSSCCQADNLLPDWRKENNVETRLTTVRVSQMQHKMNVHHKTMRHTPAQSQKQIMYYKTLLILLALLGL